MSTRRTGIRLMALAATAMLLMAASPRRTYLRELDQATEELRIYRGFDTALIVRGTYLDHSMRVALAAERRRLMNPDPPNHQAFEARMQDDEASYHDVVFSASSPLPAARSFGESDASWLIWLEADGVRERLVSVEHIRRPSPLHRELYAHLNVWGELWIARFERTVASPSSVTLHVGSGYGNGDLVWDDIDTGPRPAR